MRAVELGKVAAAAEALRLRRLTQRQVMRGAYGAVAAVFAIAVFVLLHVIAYDLLLMVLSPLVSCVVLLVFDLIVAGDPRRAGHAQHAEPSRAGGAGGAAAGAGRR